MKNTSIFSLLFALIFFTPLPLFADDFFESFQKAPGYSKLVEPERLISDVETGPVTVLIDFSTAVPAPTRKDFATKSSKDAYRAKVAAEQDRLLKAIPMVLVSRFENFPSLAVETDAAGLKALMADVGVRAIEPERFQQKHDAQAHPLIGATEPRTRYDGSGITIAVLDDGVDYNHPQLGGGGFPNSKVIGGRDTSGPVFSHDDDPLSSNPNDGHGTAVAGISAGDLTVQGDYLGGVAPGAKIAALKVFADGAGGASTTDIAEAIDWCIGNQNLDPANPIMVINMSLGSDFLTSVSQCEQQFPSYRNAIDSATTLGITVLASSGNSGYCIALNSPSCLSSVISVGAVYDETIPANITFCVSDATCHPDAANIGVCPSGLIAVTEPFTGSAVPAYSNTADFLDILAPGNDASTTDLVGSAGYSSGNYTPDFGGTSAAAPYAAGAVAVLQHAALENTGSFLTPEEVRSLLSSTGVPISDDKGGGRSPISRPLINLAAAVAEIEVDRPLIQATPTSLAVTLARESTATEVLRIRNSNGSQSMEYTVSTDQVWMNVNPQSGSSSGEEDVIEVSFNPGTLPIGIYTGAITVTADSAQNSPITILVTMSVTDVPPAIISVSPSSLEISLVEGNTAGGIPIRISNLEPSVNMAYTLSEDVSWLSLSATSGEVTDQSDEILLSVNASLTPGVYKEVIFIESPTAANSPLLFTVTLTVEPLPTPVLAVNVTEIPTIARAGDSPFFVNFTIRNSTEQVEMPYTVEEFESWLSVNPTSGSATDETDSIQVEIDPRDLGPGDYRGRIAVLAPNSENLQAIVEILLSLDSPTVTLEEAIGLRDGSLRTFGQAGWVVYRTEVVEGSASARSGDLFQEGDVSGLEVIVQAPEGNNPVLTFRYLGSGLPGDTLELDVNGDVTALPSLTTGWSSEEVSLQAGENVIQWRYISGGPISGFAVLDDVDLRGNDPENNNGWVFE